MSYKDRRKKSFGANGNKYSFTKININTNQNNENDTRYKDTNFYTNYLRKNKDNLMKKFDESHKVNYLNFGKI